jgi:hypothetical protein
MRMMASTIILRASKIETSLVPCQVSRRVRARAVLCISMSTLQILGAVASGRRLMKLRKLLHDAMRELAVLVRMKVLCSFRIVVKLAVLPCSCMPARQTEWGRG